MAFSPDALILVDYPGFNLRIAKWARKNGFRIIYYISPQVWAWKEARVKAIRRDVDKMFVILPFEKEFYQKWGYPVSYIGHPLVQVVNDFLRVHPASNDATKIITLLPGSRKQEVLVKLPIMLEAVSVLKGFRIIVAKAPSLDDEFYSDILNQYPQVEAARNETYSLLSRSRAALVTSGTATLETALFGVPQVVCYKGSAVSYQIAKRLIKIKFISLVNLIMDREVVKELIQHELTVTNIRKELEPLLVESEKREKMLEDYRQLKNLLQKEGHASASAAREITGWLRGLAANDQLNRQHNQSDNKQQ